MMMIIRILVMRMITMVDITVFKDKQRDRTVSVLLRTTFGGPCGASVWARSFGSVAYHVGGFNLDS